MDFAPFLDIVLVWIAEFQCFFRNLENGKYPELACYLPFLGTNISITEEIGSMSWIWL